MVDNKRKFRRFDLPLVVTFKPAYGSTDSYSGLIKNFSLEGICLESNDFSFIKHESLEFSLKFPQGVSSATLRGNVAWKKQNDKRCLAGVKLNTTDRKTRNNIIEKISSFGNIPINEIFTGEEPVKAISKEKNIEKVQEKAKVKEKTIKVKADQPPAKKKRKSLKTPPKNGFTKQYFKGGSGCKVTFRLPEEATVDARSVTIVGDFNNWDPAKTPMKRMKNGGFFATLDLESNREYKFKYLIDGQWENDWFADKYIPNEFGSDDSVVIV